MDTVSGLRNVSKDDPGQRAVDDVTLELASGESFRTLPATSQRLRDRLWTEIKSA